MAHGTRLTSVEQEVVTLREGQAEILSLLRYLSGGAGGARRPHVVEQTDTEHEDRPLPNQFGVGNFVRAGVILEAFLPIRPPSVDLPAPPSGGLPPPPSGGLPAYTPMVRGGLSPPLGLSQPPAFSDRAPFVPAEGPAYSTEKSPSPSDPSSSFSDLGSSASSHSRRRRRRRSRRSGRGKKVDIAARDNIILALNHAANGNRQFKADVRKLKKGKKIPVEQVVDKLLEEYESALLAQQLAIRERVRHFPWDIQKRDGKGRVIYPENTELLWPKIDDRLDRLTMDAEEIDMEVTVKEKKEMVIQALMPDQQRGLLSDIKKQHPHMRVADLTQISWEVIEEWMVWYASFERKGPTKEKLRERANRAKENGDRRPRCHWC
uniref:Uncharacterized protein n=1 Tax=Chromera velia CCMP2878 TaxID=1169474 RepID=A0A0G4I4F7_9ALVE|eukprot:Cvel_10843.t1-p1 / transcript=Cvel_10843.t1 / gene=Cvel_10843 / organism=Chromera_velia_CCMP2878 / gene_product=hypothetical protein / transcript_product=hypothetical protein / location=Cvel_scaffold663:68218-69496(-) / protein_length=376 / sequence_SO=supercontig / SO=protein_coding / is_pseudo=false